jgi:hypothetical protein
MSAAAGLSRYLVEVRNRSRDRFVNLCPLWGERELCSRRASCSCSRASKSFVISRWNGSAMGYCCPVWLWSRTKGKRPSSLRYLGLQLVKPGSRPNRLQSAAIWRFSLQPSFTVANRPTRRSTGFSTDCRQSRTELHFRGNFRIGGDSGVKLSKSSVRKVVGPPCNGTKWSGICGYH